MNFVSGNVVYGSFFILMKLLGVYLLEEVLTAILNERKRPEIAS
jgi:hypothetical protein